MSLILKTCIDFEDNRKECVASEKGKTFKLENKSEVTVKKVKVDKCIPQNVGEGRCDFLMDIQENRKVFFIELKGGNLDKALCQITDSISYLKSEYKNYIFEARIVGSKDLPNFLSSNNYRRLAKLVLPTKGKIIYRTNKFHTESI
jgi:hypothetical protein